MMPLIAIVWGVGARADFGRAALGAGASAFFAIEIAVMCMLSTLPQGPGKLPGIGPEDLSIPVLEFVAPFAIGGVVLAACLVHAATLFVVKAVRFAPRRRP
jgi:hypothetical protein